MAEGDRAFLGLTHNPFIPPNQGFFERGDRKTHLEQLRHLSQWSRRILLVTGPDEVGKTSLYRELAATLEPRVKAARINGSLVTAGREVLSAIAQGFGLAVPSDANCQLLRALLLEHVDQQTTADRLCLTLIDDAHLLDPRTLDEVMALVHESPMHLVLFGEVRVVPVVERAASQKGVGWHEIRLSGYGDADARDYLEWRFQQARYRGRIPFTDQQVREIVRLSGGLPGKIDQMANVLLVKLESGEAIGEGGGFPTLHGALLVLLLIVVGLVYFEVFDEQPPLPDQASAQVIEDPVESESPESVPLGGRGSLAENLDVVPQPGSDQTSLLLTEEADFSGSVPTGAVPEIPAPVTDGRDGELAQVEPSSTATEPDLPAEPLTSSGSRERDSAWVLAQDPEDFTLQLLTLSDLERAKAYVDKQTHADQFAIYQLQRDGRVLHVVLYGLFGTREAALRAADDLPPEVGNVQPWIRPIGLVQDAARTSLLQ